MNCKCILKIDITKFLKKKDKKKPVKTGTKIFFCLVSIYYVYKNFLVIKKSKAKGKTEAKGLTNLLGIFKKLLLTSVKSFA